MATTFVWPTVAIRPPHAPRPDTIDARLIAILDAPLAPGAMADKEHELAAALATLSVVESRAMHARLTNAKAGDELANKFARLVIERRVRLLAFIADAGRRAAMNAEGL